MLLGLGFPIAVVLIIVSFAALTLSSGTINRNSQFMHSVPYLMATVGFLLIGLDDGSLPVAGWSMTMAILFGVHCLTA